jgi:glycosyltransferase involved in cell wall biosynthesis
MKILQIIYESFGSPFGFGGAGMRAYKIFRRLKERHDITFLCMKYPGAEDREIEGLKHHFVGIESNNFTWSVLAYTLNAGKFVRNKGNKFDIIIENFLPATPFFPRYLTKTPVVLQIQDFWGKHVFQRYPFRFALPMLLTEKFYPKLYPQIIFVSDVTKERFHLPAKTITIPNGIDERLLRADEENDNSILFLSSIDLYKKGLDVLLEAFSRISPLYQNVILSIAGTGRDVDLLKHEIDKLPANVRKNVRLLGWVSGEEKTRVISRALLTVLPSRHESSPISILEAAACGKPVIVSDIPELAFVSQEGFGISFSSGSANELSAQIRLLLANSEKREALGKSGRKFAAQFLWDDIAVQFEEVLRTAAEKS